MPGVIQSSEGDTFSLAVDGASIAVLKICTRAPAIPVLRNRRINSSLFPENIGPTTTSIQPIFPLTISTLAPSSLSYLGDCAFAIRVQIEERREGGNQRNAKRFLSRNFIRAQHSPCALLIANSRFAREPAN